MIVLTRKMAAVEVAIPQQMRLMVQNGYPPTWELFSRSTGWEATIESLELTQAEQDQYENMWRYRLKQFEQEGAKV